MKNLYLLYFLIPGLVFGAAEFDTKKGVDMTATNYVTASLLNQLVDAGTIGATNKGAVIRRSGGGGTYWPDVTLNGRYTNFLWLDTATTPATLKQYVCCGDVYTNWVASTVTPNSISAAEILNYTITEVKMATNSVNQYALQDSAVTANKIAGNSIIAGKLGPASVILGNYAFGSIVGGNITNGTITVTNLADGAVTREKLGASVVDNTRLTNDAVFTANITNLAVTAAKIANNTITTNQIANNTFGYTVLDTNVSYGVVKVAAFISGVNTTPTLVWGVGVSSITEEINGRIRINFNNSFSSANSYVANATLSGFVAGAGRMCNLFSNMANSISIEIRNSGSGTIDDSSVTNAYITIIGN